MLGDQVLELKGKTTSKRVLPEEGPKVEVSFESEGTYKGTPIRELGTYWSVPRADGALYGEGQGVLMTNDGEMASWTGRGIGRFGQSGNISYRGSVFYQTSSQGKLAKLNNAVIVFEYEVDSNDNSTEKGWEWR